MVRRFRRYRPEKIVHMESVTDTVIPISPPKKKQQQQQQHKNKQQQQQKTERCIKA